MRPIRTLLAVTLIGGALAAAPTSSAAPAAYRTSVRVVTVHDGPTGSHVARIDTRLYVPSAASARHPVAAILMTHGFGLSKDSKEVTATAQWLATHGYIVLTWTAQGFGGSSGCITLDSFDYDVKDAEQVVAAILAPRHDVKHDRRGMVLGMTGGSYGGGITLNVAAADPRIRAIVPGRTWNALQYSLDPNNYVFAGDRTGFTHTLAPQGVFKEEWTSLFFASGNAQPFGGAPPSGGPKGGCPQEKLASGEPSEVAGTPCTGFHLLLCEIYARIVATGDADATARQTLANSSVQSRIGKLRAPTLLLQGQSDTLFNENDAVATYLALKQRGVPVAMTWNSGGHGGYDSMPGECDVYGGGDTGLDHCYLTQRTLAWFDHWLRGKPLRNFPDFTYFRDWVTHRGVGSDADQYAAARGYPPMPATAFRLSGSSSLVAPGGHVAAGSATFVNPPGGEPASYSETSNFTAPGSTPDFSGQAPFDPPGEATSFTSAPFRHAVVSVGVPSARLQLSHSNGQDLVFFGKVFDVAPDGSATLIKRLIAPVRVPAADVGKPVRIHLLGFAHRFAAGHRVRLTLAATDQTSYNSKVPDTITVRTGGADASTFSLPMVAPHAPPVGVIGAPSTVPLPHARRSHGGLAFTGSGPVVPIGGGVLLVLAGWLRRRRLA